MSEMILRELEGLIRDLDRGEAVFMMAFFGVLAILFAVLPGQFADLILNRYRRWIRIRLFSGLAWAVERDLPLDRLLVALEAEAWNGIAGFRNLGWRRVVTEIRERLAQGTLLGDACRPHARLLGPDHLARLREAEKAGRLAPALRSTVARLRDEEQARSRMSDSLVYSLYAIWTLGALFGIVLGGLWMMGYFIPSIERNMFSYSPQGVKSLLTGTLFSSPSIRLLTLSPLLILAVAVVLFHLRGRERWGGWLFRIPLEGPLLRMEGARDFCETLAAMAGPGVPLPEALRAVSGCARFGPHRRLAARLALDVERGADIATPLGQDRLLPPSARELLALGLRAGRPADACRRAADHLGGLIAHRRRILRLLAASALIVLTGLLIGTLAVGVFGWLVDLQYFHMPGR